MTIKHDAKIESFFRMKSTAKQEHNLNFKGTVTFPKCLWILGPWGPQQVVEMQGTNILPEKYGEGQIKNDQITLKVVTFSKLTAL